MRTGIIRRIDDLGRVVIPREIRRTLHLREGDPLEIFVGGEGEVIFKKYSPIGELGNFAKEYADSLHETTGHIAMIADLMKRRLIEVTNASTGHIAMIADRDTIIAVAGANGREFYNKPIGNAVKEAMEERTTLIMNDLQAADDENVHVIQNDDKEYTIKSQVIVPIITQGGLIGAVIIVTKDAGVKLGDMEVKLAETAARVIAKQAE